MSYRILPETSENNVFFVTFGHIFCVFLGVLLERALRTYFLLLFDSILAPLGVSWGAFGDLRGLSRPISGGLEDLEGLSGKAFKTEKT